MSYNKYRAKIVRVGKHVFRSELEYRRWLELTSLEKADRIRDLETQPPFVMWEGPYYTSSEDNHKKVRKHPDTTYTADFRYFDVDLDEVVVEDTKGFQTPEFKRNLKWWLQEFPGQLFLITTENHAVYYRGIPKDT